MKKNFRLSFPLMAVALLACRSSVNHDSWEAYGGSKDALHYSALRQIDTGNVAGLRQVWVYHCGDVDSNSQIQVNPIVIDHTLYGVSPRLKLFALDALSGKMIWTFDPAKAAAVRNWSLNVCRGVAYYRGSETDQRLFYSAGSTLYCIDALTGNPLDGFGDHGRVDLHHDGDVMSANSISQARRRV
jgi:quinoprotein glucose dehydrogenase